MDCIKAILYSFPKILELLACNKLSGYSLSLICSFDETKNNFYVGRDCIKRFCNDLKQLATEIINFEKKEMIPLTDKEITLYKSQKACDICKEKLCYGKNKKS